VEENLMPDPLAEEMAQLLRDVLDQGFLPPLAVATVAANGSVIVFRYEAPDNAPGLTATVLCEHLTGDVMALPINLMIVDQTGRAAHVVIDPLARQPEGETPT
jgi:hypothetical protein